VKGLNSFVESIRASHKYNYRGYQILTTNQEQFSFGMQTEAVDLPQLRQLVTELRRWRSMTSLEPSHTYECWYNLFINRKD
jgi:hypothetical protein